MDASALKISLKSLDARWSSLEHWLWFCAAIVFLGVAIEVVPIVWEYLVEAWDFERGTIHSPERPSRLKFGLESLGSFLVALGVFGELLVGIWMAKVETEVRDKTATLVSITEGEAAAANNRAAELKKEAEGERFARVELEANVAWRSLTKNQATELSSKLKMGRRPRVTVGYEWDNVEGFGFATSIAAALKLARWNVISVGAMYCWGAGPACATTPVGVVVTGDKNPSVPGAAHALVKALNAMGFDCKFENPPATVTTVPMFVHVGLRPSGPQGEAKQIEQELKKKQATTK